nr:beta-1,3-galactosyltransferase 1-like [Rhipicephalus microplus]
MGFVVVFLLGATPDQDVQRKVLAENDIYGDVVQGDFIESYENLTYKTAMMIRWTRAKCSKAEFVLKIDDDMILSVWDFAVILKGLEGIKHSMWGYLYRHHGPNRNVSSKWYVSEEEYAPDTYPDFLSGTGYLISGDAISALDDVIHDECFFPLEDIYLTAIVAERAQGDFIDCYENLTYKTTMLIRWTRAKCSKAEFGLKIDGDMILSVYDLAVVVNGLEGFKRSMWSYFYRDHGPNRNVDCKLYGSHEEYEPDTYPDFSGTGYLISGDAISALDDVIYP